MLTTRDDSHHFDEFKKNNSIPELDTDLDLRCAPIEIEPAWYIVCASFELILTTVTIFSNIALILAVLRDKKLLTTTNYFILSLSVADLFVGFAMPLDAAAWMYPPLLQDKYVCIFRYTLIFMACGASVTSMLWIAVDRYIAVTYPLRYPNVMTSERASLAIITIWILNIFLGFLPLLGVNSWHRSATCSLECTLTPEYIFSCFVYILVCGVILVFIHFKIFHKALGQNRRISVLQTGARVTGYNTRLVKSVWTLVIILGTFVACWLPMELIVVSQYFNYNPNVSLYKTAAVCLGVLNSCLNPFIYGWRNRELRGALWVYFKGRRRASAESASSHMSTVVSRVETLDNTEASNEPPEAFASESCVTEEVKF